MLIVSIGTLHPNIAPQKKTNNKKMWRRFALGVALVIARFGMYWAAIG